MAIIESPKNAQIVGASRLHRRRERRRAQATLVEGPTLVEEAVEAGQSIESVFGLADDRRGRELANAARSTFIACSDHAIARLSTTKTPQSPIAVLRIPEPAPIRRDTLRVAVTDPGNAGTLIRSAAAFGLDISFEEGAVDVWSPKVIRSAAGAHFHTTVVQGPNVPESCRLLATVVAGGRPLRSAMRELDPSARYAILVGSEAHGLDPARVQDADLAVSILMPGGTESLNAAVAGSILAYELSLWRRETSGETETTNLPPL